jgi:hypothetical protein
MEIISARDSLAYLMNSLEMLIKQLLCHRNRFLRSPGRNSYENEKVGELKFATTLCEAFREGLLRTRNRGRAESWIVRDEVEEHKDGTLPREGETAEPNLTPRHGSG